MEVPSEFKLDDSKTLTALGQLVIRMRHTFQQQPDRNFGFAVIVTMQSVEVFFFSRQQDAPPLVQRSGAQVQLLKKFTAADSCSTCYHYMYTTLPRRCLAFVVGYVVSYEICMLILFVSANIVSV